MASNIKGITIEIDGNTSGLDKALKSVNSTTSGLNSELKQVNKLLKFDPGNSTLLAQKQDLLTKSIENTSSKLESLKGAQSQVEAQFKSGKIGEDQYRAFQREVESTEQSLKSYESQMSGMSAEQEKLGQNTKRLGTFFEATGKDVEEYRDILGSKLTNAIKNGTASSGDMEVALNKMGKAALGSETDLASMKKSLDKIDDGGSIDAVKNDLNELKETSNTTDGELAKLGGGISSGNMMQAAEIISGVGDKIKEFAQDAQDAFRDIDDGMDTFTTTTGQGSDVIKKSFDDIYKSMPIDSTADLGQALGSLSQQFGFSGDKLTAYGKQMMQFAGINNTDVKSSIDNARSAIETYGLSYDDLGSVLDTFTHLSQQTGVSVDDLMNKTVEGAPQIKALGLSFDEGAQMLGQFEQAGVDGAGALSSLSKANVVYAKDGKSLQDGLNGTIDAILGAKNQTDALTLASETFGTKGATRMVDAIQRGTINLGDLGYAAEDAAGAVSTTFDATVDPIDKQTTASQTAKLAMADIGATISEALAPVLDKLVGLIQSVADWFNNLSPATQNFAIVLGGALIVFAGVAPVVIAMAVAFTALDASLLPIIGIVAAIIAVIAAVILVIMNWGSIVDWLKGVWGSISDFFGDLFGKIGDIFDSIGETITGVWDAVSETVGSVVGDLVGGVVDFFTGLWEDVTGIFNDVKEAITGPIQTASDVISGIVEGIKKFFDFKIKFPEIKIPEIKLPHFSITGEFNPLKLKIPKISIDWYANGGILTKPTMFGMNGSSPMMGGEAGAEAILPLSKLETWINQAFANSFDNLAQLIAGNDSQIIQLLAIIAAKQMVLELNGKAMAKEIAPDMRDAINQIDKFKKQLTGEV